MSSITLLDWIANAAVVLAGVRGEIGRRARHIGCSRQTLYHHRDRVTQAVALARELGPDPAGLLDQLEALRGENRQLRARLAEAVDFPRDKQDRFVVTGAAIGLSLNQLGELLTILLGRCAPSRSAIHRTIREAAGRASRALDRLDHALASRVTYACLDEIYAAGRPILMAVEPRSMAWFIGLRSEDCRGATWSRTLQPWASLQVIVADAGTGLQAGIEQCARERRDQDRPEPDLGLDVFHTIREARSVLARSWHKVEHAWHVAEADDARAHRVGRRGRDRRGPAGTARLHWKVARRRFAEHERAEAAWGRIHAALGPFAEDGRLNDTATARTIIAGGLPALQGEAWSRVRNLLTHPRAVTFLDRLHRDLAAAEPDHERREAFVRLWWLRRRRPSRGETTSRGANHVAHLVHRVWCRKRWPDWRESYDRVSEVLRGVVRASSAVECVNSVVRMHQDRHRRLPQGLIDLKRLHWNCHRFRAGRRKGRSPYELAGLAGSLDFWDQLNTPAA